jgi:hypothetical protein
MGSHKQRLARLEGPQKTGAPIIIVEPDETSAEAWERHVAEHPEDEHAEAGIYIVMARPNPPATKAATKETTAAPGAGPHSIIK